MSCATCTTPPAPTNETRAAAPPKMITTKSARKPRTMSALLFIAGSAASPVSGEMPLASSWLLFSSVARIRPTELRRLVVPDASRLTRPSKSLACSSSCWISANSSGFNCANVRQGSAADTNHYRPNHCWQSSNHYLPPPYNTACRHLLQQLVILLTIGGELHLLL